MTPLRSSSGTDDRRGDVSGLLPWPGTGSLLGEAAARRAETLIEPEKLKAEADWIEAGRRVFEEVDDLELRTFDPKLVAAARTCDL
jgi:hypothetical protein